MVQNGTFIAGNSLTGCHFSICVCDKELYTAIYGDSLGKPAPGKQILKIHCYVKGFFGEPEKLYFGNVTILTVVDKDHMNVKTIVV